MFALAFRFPANRYHATPWGKNVNEADVAWPPEPWRLLRALIATYWRKGNQKHWSEQHLESLINALAESLPVYKLPTGTVHSHTRHYMPIGALAGGTERTSLIFDAFVSLPKNKEVVAAWPEVNLDGELFELAADLADAIGYLGRAESWTECQALSEWDGEANCVPAENETETPKTTSQTPQWLIAPLAPEEYKAARARLITNMKEKIKQEKGAQLSDTKLETELNKMIAVKKGPNTLPERLIDALILDTADYQNNGWNKPPASREVLYSCDEATTPGVIARVPQRAAATKTSNPTVARFILAGRPRPRVEDTVKIGEIMRWAAMSKFGSSKASSGRKIYHAPPLVSGRDDNGKPIKNPSHPHAFWLPEDADSDGLIDHISVYIAGGMDENIQAKLDRITRIWTRGKETEWRLALEGFATPDDFPDSAIFGRSDKWQSATPFLAAGYIKRTGDIAKKYRGEIIRLVKSRGIDRMFGFEASDISVELRKDIQLGGRARRAIHFHRFRSGGGEAQRDTHGALLELTFPTEIQGPLVLGYGSHFGLGLFAVADSLTDAN